ncbi:MAG: NAD(P)/FAD-dependent oxidoreductase [Candidatus Nanopelagicales bacterium]|nr:NAD(P)/FAD-dependent oxidoreductase [Candidatus Nanopelagicales bacterium]
MAEQVDVVVIGSGINGLSAAALLARKGRRVVVLESADVPGGAVRTEEVTAPGFRHDLFAMNLGLFAGGPVNAALGPALAEHGFALVPSARPFCSVFPDGTMLGVQADAAATLANVAAVAPEDVEAWQKLSARLGVLAPYLFGVLGADMPSWKAARAVWKARRDLGMDGVYEIARLALASTRAFTEQHFRSPRTRALMASWGMHLDFAPDIPGGALFAFLETMGGQMFGMVIGQGGARTVVDALVGVIESSGGSVRCGSRVAEILVTGDAATGVRLANGDVINASRAVISNVNPALMPDLLPDTVAARPEVARAREFRPGYATMMIHLAMDELPAWKATEARTYNYVHIGPYIDDMARAYTDAAAGQLPPTPTLVVGQPTVSDPSRAPEGKHVLWVQVRVLPLELVDGRSWDDAARGYADHVMGILEQYAPGIGAQVIARTVLSPADLQRYNVNLVMGDSLGGSHHPAQFFFLRPVPGWGRHRSPVSRLFLCGASTWPGGGVGGASGAMVADAVG